MNLLLLKNVKKSFLGKSVLEIDELAIKKGKINGFLGRNGAGKSTTIKIIMGVLPKDQGEIFFDDQEIHFDDKVFKMKVGYCPDYAAVFDQLTMMEHFEFISHLYNVKKNDAFFERINDHIKEFELEDYKGLKLKQLSKGNRQKVSIIASVLHKPDLLIYDEPTLGLDPFALKQFKDFLKKYTKAGGTVFLSSHALDIITEIADNVSLIHQGKIIDRNVLISEVVAGNVDLEKFMLNAIESVG